MFNQERISGSQAVFFTVAAAIGTIFLPIPGWVVEQAGRDGWMAVPIGYAIGILLALSLVKLGRRFPDKTFVQYLPLVLGAIPGKLVGLLYIGSFTFFAALLIRQFAELMILLMPDTPPLMFVLMITVPVVYAIKAGLEVFARTCQLLITWVVLGLMIGIFASMGDFEPRHFQPFLENGFIPVLKAVPVQIAFAGEAALFMALWLPCLRGLDKAYRASIIGISVAAVVLTLVVVVTVGIFGPDLVLTQTFSVFSLARLIKLADFIRGFEGLLLAVWVPASFLKITIFLYPGPVGLAQWLNLKEYKPLVIPLAVILVGTAMLPENLEELNVLLTFNDTYLILPLVLSIPLILLIAIVRRLDESIRTR